MVTNKDLKHPIIKNGAMCGNGKQSSILSAMAFVGADRRVKVREHIRAAFSGRV